MRKGDSMRKECRKERRKHRDNTPELLLNQALLGAVIKQAFDDAENYAEKKEKGWNNPDATEKEKTEYNNAKDAKAFLTSEKRLERFITSYTLPLSASFLRRKYYELQQKEA